MSIPYEAEFDEPIILHGAHNVETLEFKCEECNKILACKELTKYHGRYICTACKARLRKKDAAARKL